MDAKDRIIDEQRKQIKELTQRVLQLELALAKATKDSSNSSKPPSSDFFEQAKKSSDGKASRKKRKRGGQPGHRRKLREPLPPERVDETFMYAMSDAGRHRSFTMHGNKFLDIVRNPPDVPEARTLAERFTIVECVDGSRYDMSQDYFRFLFEEGVEPTNNHSEQQVRHCVLDRRVTQGTRSERGQHDHERMWTAIATCAKQGRGFFDFLHDSIQARLEGRPGPSLLPSFGSVLETHIASSEAA